MTVTRFALCLEIAVWTADKILFAVLPLLTGSAPLLDNNKHTVQGLFIGKTAVN